MNFELEYTKEQDDFRKEVRSWQRKMPSVPKNWVQYHWKKAI